MADGLDGGDERLAVLQLVAAGRVSPQEAVDLLAALEPVAAAAPRAAAAVADRAAGRDGPAPQGTMLRVHCEDADQECDFSLPVEDVDQIGDMLPPDMARQVPARLLLQVPRLACTRKSGTILRYQDAPFELEISQEDG